VRNWKARSVREKKGGGGKILPELSRLTIIMGKATKATLQRGKQGKGAKQRGKKKGYGKQNPPAPGGRVVKDKYIKGGIVKAMRSVDRLLSKVSVFRAGALLHPDHMQRHMR